MFRRLKAYTNVGALLRKPEASVHQFYPIANFCKKVESHYDALGVSPDATLTDIKAAYYKLTLEYHPDRNPSDEAKRIFQKVSNAYEVLSNYEARKIYDTQMMIPKKRIPDIVATAPAMERRDRPGRLTKETYDPISKPSRVQYTQALREKLFQRKIEELDALDSIALDSIEKHKTFFKYYAYVILAVIIGVRLHGGQDINEKQSVLMEFLHQKDYMNTTES